MVATLTALIFISLLCAVIIAVTNSQIKELKKLEKNQRSSTLKVKLLSSDIKETEKHLDELKLKYNNNQVLYFELLENTAKLKMERESLLEEIRCLKITLKKEPDKKHKRMMIPAPSRFEDVVYHTQLHGEVLKPDLNEADPESPFYGKKVVITGEFPIPRKELGNILKKHLGADIDSSITERTDFVLVGEDPGPAKMEKVDEYGIETMEADELMPIIEPYL